jgi:hypothetical protein
LGNRSRLLNAVTVSMPEEEEEEEEEEYRVLLGCL